MPHPVFGDRWKTVRTLGEGGQGVVYLVEDLKDSDKGHFALKRFSSNRQRNLIERFSRELEALKAVSHPSLIRIIDHDASSNGHVYYVMEYHEGCKPLNKLIGTDKNPFFARPQECLHLFGSLLGVIGTCNDAQIVHRDLSPANVLVLPDKSIKVIDFGLCQIEGGELLTLTEEGIGTPNYMAPECEAGRDEAIDFRADLYSAGKILWSAVTNKTAFAREQPAFTNRSMHSMFPNAPLLWHLHHIFEKTIRHSQNERWSNMKEAYEDWGRIGYMINAGVPPIELLESTCHACLRGSLQDFDGSHVVFGNPNPRGIRGVRCNYCGCCFAIDYSVRKATMEFRKVLR